VPGGPGRRNKTGQRDLGGDTHTELVGSGATGALLGAPRLVKVDADLCLRPGTAHDSSSKARNLVDPFGVADPAIDVHEQRGPGVDVRDTHRCAVTH
jgi:hypothetical protein